MQWDICNKKYTWSPVMAHICCHLLAKVDLISKKLIDTSMIVNDDCKSEKPIIISPQNEKRNSVSSNKLVFSQDNIDK